MKIGSGGDCLLVEGSRVFHCLCGGKRGNGCCKVVGFHCLGVGSRGGVFPLLEGCRFFHCLGDGSAGRGFSISEGLQGFPLFGDGDTGWGFSMGGGLQGFSLSIVVGIGRMVFSIGGRLQHFPLFRDRDWWEVLFYWWRDAGFSIVWRWGSFLLVKDFRFFHWGWGLGGWGFLLAKGCRVFHCFGVGCGGKGFYWWGDVGFSIVWGWGVSIGGGL